MSAANNDENGGAAKAEALLGLKLQRPAVADGDDAAKAGEVTLREALGGRRTVVALLRRFGCVLCREGAAELSRLRPELDALGVGVLAIGHEALGYEEFVAGGFFDGPVLLDTDKVLYRECGATRASKLSMLRPAVWRNISRAKARRRADGTDLGGNLEGDGFQLGGMMVIGADGEVLFRQPQKLLGDHTPLGEVLAAATGDLAALKRIEAADAEAAAEPDTEAVDKARAEARRLAAESRAHVFGHSRCGYTDRAKRVFRDMLGVPHGETDLDKLPGAEGRAMRLALTADTGSATFPWVYVDGEFCGGGDETLQLYLDGKLDKLKQ